MYDPRVVRGNTYAAKILPLVNDELLQNQYYRLLLLKLSKLIFSSSSSFVFLFLNTYIYI